MYILSQIIVVISDILFILSMLSRTKPKVIIYLIVSALFFGIHYLCLQAFTGAVLSLIELILLIVLYFFEKKYNNQFNIPIVIIFGIITICVSIFTWETWASVIPMISMIIYLSGLIFTNIVFVKASVFVRIVLNVIYMLFIESYIGAVCNVIIVFFTIYGIVKDVKSSPLRAQTD